MIIQIFFTMDEITKFFADNGFTVEQRTFGKFEKGYHGRSEWVEAEEPAVVIGADYVKASDLFQKVAEFRIKNLVAPTGDLVKKAVEILFQSICKAQSA